MCEQPQLLAGFGKINITPDYPVGLRGYSTDATRIHEMVVDPVYATCIALTEGEETILIYTLDHCCCDQTITQWIRDAVTPATGIPGEHIFTSATHTHSAPSTGAHPNAMRYRGDLVVWCVQAAQAALADRAPAKVLLAKQEIPGMNFVRHFITQNGTVAGIAFGSFKDNPPVDYTAQPDKTLMLVKFQREGLKKSILMVNWQAHPDRSSEIGKLNIAPSFPGPLRDTLANYTGDLVAYFTGADGNTVMDTRIEKDKHNLNWREYGIKMAEIGYGLYKQLQEVPGSGIAVNRRVVEVETDHGMDHRLEDAVKVVAFWKKEGLAPGNEFARANGFSSVYHANAVRGKASMGKSRTLELNTFRVGSIGFTTGTYEMFSEAGIAIRERSPFANTFLLTGNFSYIPSKEAYDYQCYEAVTGFYARGTGERLVDEYIEMLNEIK